MKTKDRIVQASIELFNAKGERNVTTNHIASHLSISPGNLYYHFRNKEEIIRNIFTKYADHMQVSFEPVKPSQDPVKILTNYLDAVFSALYHFNFLYDNLPVIMARDPELKSQYLDIHNKMMDKIHQLVVSLEVANVIKMDADDIEDFANIIKQQVTFWISYCKTSREDTQITTEMIYHGLLKVLLLFKPYVTQEYREPVREITAHYTALANGESSEQGQPDV
ncbi:TetR/AcrR family transcriptional regulator [Psychrosphaera ytuae]|uniref:TetR/AcrR family transcriptional regulator n=1 Tax=Psychrosphaera ytuae TaxID=2820710 RepID=A0A975HHB5_9GAMM|nr:TetR/AcrR family transcriptional regulator [Psychrosphaera ytuae]QTH62940.1 TetR/AcrR family transcriptional regulator [Psychrosphaera ytuae]